MTDHKELMEAASRIDTGRTSQRTVEPHQGHRPVRTQPQLSTADTVRNFVRENPGPSLLIGAGLAWYFVNREQNMARSLPDRMRDHATTVADHASTVAEHASTLAENASETYQGAKDATAEKLGEVKDLGGQKVESATELAQRHASQAKGRYDSLLEENPLALGACAVAAGLALGLLLPSTKRENELLGEARDSLVDQARHIVNEARSTAVNTLRSRKESVQEKLLEAKDEVQEAVMDSVQEAKESALEEIKAGSPEWNESESKTKKGNES